MKIKLSSAVKRAIPGVEEPGGIQMTRLKGGPSSSSAKASPMRSFGAPLVALGCAVLTSCPVTLGAEGQGSDYEEVLRTPATDPIEFVHLIDDVAPQVHLDIYQANHAKKTSWHSTGAPTTTTEFQLGPSEDFVLSPDWRMLGVRTILAVPSGPGSPPGIAQETRFAFIKGPPGAQPPAPLRGERQVQMNDEGTLLLFTRREREHDGPASTDFLKFKPSSQLGFEPAGTIATATQGVIQISRSGSIIAQADGSRVALLNAFGEETAQERPGIGFELAENGQLLAVREADSVRLLQLSEAGELVPDGERKVEHLPGPPLEVAMADRWALIRTRKSVHLIGPDNVERWRRTYADEVVGSVDLRLFPGAGSEGTLVAAIGRLSISHKPGRRSGQTDWGTAQGIVDVVDRNGHDLIAPHSFRTLRWTHDAPRVRILERSARVVVRSGDVVLISRPLFDGDSKGKGR